MISSTISFKLTASIRRMCLQGHRLAHSFRVGPVMVEPVPWKHITDRLKKGYSSPKLGYKIIRAKPNYFAGDIIR